MSDEVQETTATGQAPDAPAVQTTEPQSERQTFDADYVRQLRQEAAEWRTKLREMEAERKRAEEARLQEEQKWKELAEKRAQELAELQPVQKRLDTMLATLQESNKRRIEQVPEQYRSMIPEYDDPAKLAAWLDANAQLLQLPNAPTLNGGAGQDKARAPKVVLTDEELEVAKKMGIPAEEYARFKRE